MFKSLLLLALIVLSLQVCAAKRGKQCDPKKCYTVKCRQVQRSECDPVNQRFVARFTDCNCNCCSYCLDKQQPVECDTRKCDVVRCANIQRQDCNPVTQRYVPRFSTDCNCCAYCEDKVPPVAECDAGKCAAISCRRVEAQDCLSSEKFVAALQVDHGCNCCAFCQAKSTL
ncbi:hypothetical protein HDE_09699 [Halotydeus destructor]|nr:hypothetical protein HDE_09699 [Halotydeus destructor]